MLTGVANQGEWIKKFRRLGNNFCNLDDNILFLTLYEQNLKGHIPDHCKNTDLTRINGTLPNIDHI